MCMWLDISLQRIDAAPIYAIYNCFWAIYAKWYLCNALKPMDGMKKKPRKQQQQQLQQLPWKLKLKEETFTEEEAEAARGRREGRRSTWFHRYCVLNDDNNCDFFFFFPILGLPRLVFFPLRSSKPKNWLGISFVFQFRVWSNNLTFIHPISWKNYLAVSICLYLEALRRYTIYSIQIKHEIKWKAAHNKNNNKNRKKDPLKTIIDTLKEDIPMIWTTMGMRCERR